MDQVALTDLTEEKLKGLGEWTFRRLVTATGVTAEEPFKEVEFSNNYYLKANYLVGDIRITLGKGGRSFFSFNLGEGGITHVGTRKLSLFVGDKNTDLDSEGLLHIGGDPLDATVNFSKGDKVGPIELGVKLVEWIEESVKDRELKHIDFGLRSSGLP